MNAIRILLREIIDYAGLFPPAALDMEQAVRNYVSYRRGPHKWMLGRLIVPVAALGEFEAAARPLLPLSGEQGAWPLSVLIGRDVAADAAVITAFNRTYAGQVQIDAVELKAQHADDITAATRLLPAGIETFFELPIGDDPAALVEAVAAAGGRAKVRTGGTTADAFPAAPALFRFIDTCVLRQVPFKATAGLHHPLRAVHTLTYQPTSPTSLMFGFLNVFLTAALLHAGSPPATAAALLEETERDSLHFDADGIRWRQHRIGLDTLATTRERVALSFGSCSFHEPIDDLKAMQLL